MLVQALVLAMAAVAPLAHAQEDICSLPLGRGVCRIFNPRFGFSTKTGQCESFNDCVGNDNSFATLEECEAACEATLPPPPEPPAAADCTLPLLTGPCRAFFRKWGFSTRKRRCVEFTYGGCLGNENRFDTEEECMEACPYP